MKLSLDLRTSLTQTLTPQQIQYLKLLQLPLVQLEQQVRGEIEQNPMLDEVTFDVVQEEGDFENFSKEKDTDYSEYDKSTEKGSAEALAEAKSKIEDQGDPFEFYKMVWRDDADSGKKGRHSDNDFDNDSFQIKDNGSFIEDILQQLYMLNLPPEELVLGEQIIGNVDTDGYLRRDIKDIVDETNKVITDLNFERYREIMKQEEVQENTNPAQQFAISTEARLILERRMEIEQGRTPEEEESDYIEILPVDLIKAERLLKEIRNLEPQGFASRNIKECLLAQCRAMPKKNAAQKLAQEILENAYEPFSMKHYHVIMKQLGVTEEYLKEAIDLIRHLNPKPGGGDFASETNTVIPDFSIYRDEETGEPVITVNDSRLPALQLNKAYDKLKKEAKIKLFNKETRDWIRNKYEDAKFLIQAIRQRKNTMLKVMTAIAGLQRNYFFLGPTVLKPLIYKDVAEKTGLDISTVCRIVNGKYVQTEFGTHELKFFFSESLPNEDGEEVSTRVIKQIIKDIVDEEPKNKPYSDDKLSKILKEKGYNVARRTVAKYREQLKIPVARLRKEL
jgi:RNA polymerase sigma-54 factor